MIVDTSTKTLDILDTMIMLSANFRR